MAFPTLRGGTLDQFPALARRPSIFVRIIRIGQPFGSCDAVGTRDLPGEIQKHGAQVLTEAEQIHGARAAREEEGEDRLVGFLRVAVRTGEHEVIAAIERGLTAAGRHVIQRDRVDVDASFAVRTHSAVALEQPLASVRVSRATCGQRGVLRVGSRGATASARGLAGATQWYKGLEGD